MTTTIGGPMEPQPVQSAAGAADAKVRVSFVTKHDQYRIPETGMLLPANLRRYGLSEVVNHILGRGT